MKKLVLVFMLLFTVISVLRLNLPSNEIRVESTDTKQNNIFEIAISEMMFSDSVADWQYIDLVVVKFACSERLEMTLIALPFKRWKRYDDKKSICSEN
jgi:hypothetical protein